LQGLAGALTVVVLLAAPAAASAAPQFEMNGIIVGTATRNVVASGTLTLESNLIGELKCRVIAGLAIWNEGGQGLASLEAWQPYDCSAATECPGEAVVTPEHRPELIEEENSKSEKKYSAKRGGSSLPWPAEAIAPEAGKSRLNIRKIRLNLQCPAEGLAAAFLGNLEPLIVNGTKNGLSPSHLLFEGKGGKTGFLSAGACLEEPSRCYGEGGEPTLYLSGELTTLGTSEELMTGGFEPL
jgi:hypothetical protein